MDIAWVLAVAAFFGGCEMSIRLVSRLMTED